MELRIVDVPNDLDVTFFVFVNISLERSEQKEFGKDYMWSSG